MHAARGRRARAAHTSPLTPDFYYSNYDCKVARRGPVQVMLHAPREEATLRRARRDYFGEVRNNICDLAKIVRGRTALGCRGGEGVSGPQHERLWGFRARR